MKRLRSYARISDRSDKVKADASSFARVYKEVDVRSDGRCEVEISGDSRCSRRATEHHHLFKPRRSHHTAGEIVHVCRTHHELFDYPYARGRLCYVGSLSLGHWTRFLFVVRFAADKFTATPRKEFHER